MPIYWKFEERNRSERQKFSESNDVGDERWTVLLGCTYKLTGRQGGACVSRCCLETKQSGDGALLIW
jgi:hypothetical protein